MLQDPENPHENWTEIVWAATPGQAKAKCERIAEKYDLVEVQSISQETKNPNKNGEYKFLCWLSGEVTPNDDGNN